MTKDQGHQTDDVDMENAAMENQPERMENQMRNPFSSMAKGTNGGLGFQAIDPHGENDLSDGDKPLDCESDDESCPDFLLTKEEKKRLREPWRNALITTLFDKKLSYEVLIKRLRINWSLKGDIALTDVGCAYYMVRFTSMEDYNFVLTQGLWIIGDSYLTIRKWVPNFVAVDAPIRFLTAWVQIPQLSVEYFDKQFLHRIGSKIGRVISIDRNTEAMSRGQYVRFSIEVDLSKTLLSKFRLNGRVWKIQYEGLELICFRCGKLGHKDQDCDLELVCDGEGNHRLTKKQPIDGQEIAQKPRPEEQDQFGS